MITLCHVFWTVLFWDGCHKKGTTSTWWMGICFAVTSHYAMSALVIIFHFTNINNFAFFLMIQTIKILFSRIKKYQTIFLTKVVLELRKSNEISNSSYVRAGSYRTGKCSDLILGYGYNLVNIKKQNEVSIL